MTARRERCRAKSFAAHAPRLIDRVKDYGRVPVR